MGERGRAAGRIVLLLTILGAGVGVPGRVSAGDPASLQYRAGALCLEHDRALQSDEDPGKIRRAILLTGGEGAAYLMAWDLERLEPSEWLSRALGPVVVGGRTWAEAWLPSWDFAAVVEVPPAPGAYAMRVYAARRADVGVALLCHGVGAPDFSAACDALFGSLQVDP